MLPCFVRCSNPPWGAHFISILIHGKQDLLPKRTFSIQECPCMPCTGSEVSLCWMVRICRGLPSGIISSLPIAFFAQNGRIDLSLDMACHCRCPTHTQGPTVRVLFSEFLHSPLLHAVLTRLWLPCKHAYGATIVLPITVYYVLPMSS